MLAYSYSFKRFALALVACGLAFLAMPAPARADSGTVQMTITRAGFIFGVAGGRGVLRYHGRSYPFTVSGLSVGTFGAGSADLVGRAFGLRGPGSIAGTYTAAGAGLAAAGGARAARLRNSRGVVMELRGRQVGFEFSIDLSGMTIRMQ